MKVPTFRFSWLEYHLKRNIILKTCQFLFGTLFLHSRVIARFLFRDIPFKSKDLVLDIGSGDGNFANWISYHSSCKVIGVDRLSKRIRVSIKTARRYKIPNKFLCSDIEKETIDFKKESFDKILIIDTLEHFKNPQKIIQLANNWLKTAGYLFISTPAKNQHRIFLHSYRDTFSYGEDRHFFEGFDISQFIDWLKKAGFKGKIKAKYIFYNLHQFSWEISEIIRKYKILYALLLPLFEILTFFDRILQIGKGGNGIILIARK